ncbi:HET-domain-containing protein [Glonium stellatum]|uniref:HET-domain-containing protein n=1 Tax=Glonium stellatum TaxID=574774 RepID=A0A8E2EWR8_9PEZI|nr:HET-domain-containing protein [Glonium stellatum]
MGHVFNSSQDSIPIHDPFIRYVPPIRADDTPQPDNKVNFRKTKFVKITRGKIFGKIKFQYNYKPLKDDEIRLIELEKPSEDNKIRCKIHVKPLKEVRGKYEALSYHWGTKQGEIATNTIYVDDAISKFDDLVLQVIGKSKPKEFEVHDNLYNALTYLRSDKEPVILWIDAICINQRSDPLGKEEKEKQVARMADIYNSAYRVIVWLGPPEPKTDLAFKFIKRIVVLREFDKLLEDGNYSDEWVAFTDLMRYPWFSRRWVVQEIALARKATLICGKSDVSWNDFADAVALFVTTLDRIKTFFSDPAALLDVEALGAIQLVLWISNLIRKSENGDIQEHLVCLETLVCSLLFFTTGTAHDAIYSLLSLARDTSQKYFPDRSPPLERPKFNLKVDYSRHAIEVFMEFTRSCIETSRSLDIICRHWAPNVDGAPFPSWISKIADSSFGEPEDALQGRRNGDSFVGAPYRDSQKIYNASRGTITASDDFYFGPHEPIPLSPTMSSPTKEKASEYSLPIDGPFSGILNVKGFQIATIYNVSGRILRGMIDHTWLCHGGWDRSRRSRVPDKLWRTLVADRGPNGSNPTGWYRRACAQCLTDVAITDINGDFNVSYVQPSDQKPRSDILAQFLQMVRRIVYNRKFFLANPWLTNQLEPLYGLGPGRAEKEDIICILAGCTVPVILRKHMNEKNEIYYEMIGEAFVYGKMDGEAMAGLDHETVRTRFDWFTLR